MMNQTDEPAGAATPAGPFTPPERSSGAAGIFRHARGHRKRMRPLAAHRLSAERYPS